MRSPPNPKLGETGLARIAVITNAVPNYRLSYYRSLIQRFGERITIFCQDQLEGNLELAHSLLESNIHLVRATTLARGRLVWQHLPFRSILSDFDVVFVYGNPRLISSVALATMLRMLGKPVVICGHAHTAGANAAMESIRLAWWRWFDYIYVYTEGCVARLRMRRFHKQTIVSMNNGLDQDAIESERRIWDAAAISQWRQRRNLYEAPLLLSCARLEPKNRFDLMIEIMPSLTHDYPSLGWCVIGDGREREGLMRRAKAAGVERHIRWLGPVYSESELAPWFCAAQMLIHPGAIGLTLLHAYGYGLPVVTHDNDENQMPEIAACTPSGSDLRFREGSADSLERAIRKGLADSALREKLSAEAIEVARSRYNTNVMARRFSEMMELAGGNGA